MKYSALIAALLAVAAVTGCEKPTVVNNPPPVVSTPPSTTAVVPVPDAAVPWDAPA